jgi:hypothetical protein
VLERAFDLRGSPLWEQGAAWPAVALRRWRCPARGLPNRGERVLDLCAAPAARPPTCRASADRAEIVAVERHPGRANALRAA